MPQPTNTYTIVIADAHSNSVTCAGIAASNHIDAVLSIAQTRIKGLSALTAADTWTLTVSQP